MLKPSTALTLGAFALAATSCGNGNQKAFEILDRPVLSDDEIGTVCNARTDFETQTCVDEGQSGSKAPLTPCQQLRAYTKDDCLTTLERTKQAANLSPVEVEALCRARTAEVLRARVTQMTPSQLGNHCRSRLSGGKR